jgi:ribosomal protein L29
MSFGEASDQDLVGQLKAAERALVSDRFQHSLGQLENTAQLRERRKLVARLLGELRSREIARELPKGSLSAMQVDGDAPGVSQAQGEAGGFLTGIVDKLTQGS